MTKNKKGFTIIEVVLVLAIAGLIFLMVFIALPALQRSQRNTRRRQDMARILSAVTDYQSNNGGKSPVMASDFDPDFVNHYVDDTCSKGVEAGATFSAKTYTYECTGDQFRDPDGTNYRMTFDKWSSGQSTIGYLGSWFDVDSMRREHRIFLVAQSECSGNEDAPTKQKDGYGNVAIVYALEGGAMYCGDNQ